MTPGQMVEVLDIAYKDSIPAPAKEIGGELLTFLDNERLKMKGDVSLSAAELKPKKGMDVLVYGGIFLRIELSPRGQETKIVLRPTLPNLAALWPDKSDQDIQAMMDQGIEVAKQVIQIVSIWRVNEYAASQIPQHHLARLEGISFERFVAWCDKYSSVVPYPQSTIGRQKPVFRDRTLREKIEDVGEVTYLYRDIDTDAVVVKLKVEQYIKIHIFLTWDKEAEQFAREFIVNLVVYWKLQPPQWMKDEIEAADRDREARAKPKAIETPVIETQKQHISLETESELLNVLYDIQHDQGTPAWWREVSPLFYQYKKAHHKYTQRQFTMLIGLNDEKYVGEMLRLYRNHPKPP